MNQIKQLLFPVAVDERDQCDISPQEFYSEQEARFTYQASVNTLSSLSEAISIFAFQKCINSRKLLLSKKLSRSDKNKIKRTVDAYFEISSQLIQHQSKI